MMRGMHWFRMGEAASLLGVGIDTVRRLADAGKLRTRRSAGGQRLVEGRGLARLLASRSRADDAGAGRPLSARNRLPGVVIRVVRDRVAAQVEIQAGGHRLVSLLTREAADALRLEPGMPAVACVKATNVFVEAPARGARRARA